MSVVRDPGYISAGKQPCSYATTCCVRFYLSHRSNTVTMSAAAVGRAVRSGAPAQVSRSKLAAPLHSPVYASVKRASQAPYNAAAPARSASLPCATGRGNGTSRSRSPKSCLSTLEDVLSFLKANPEGMHHALSTIEGTESGNKNIPTGLIGRLFDFDVSTSSALSVKRGPLMRMVSEKKVSIPVTTYVAYEGERQEVECKEIIGWLRNNDTMEFRARHLEKRLAEVGAQPGNLVLVSMTVQDGQLAMELRVLRQEAVTEEVRAAMKRFLVTRKPRGQKANKVGRAAHCSVVQHVMPVTCLYLWGFQIGPRKAACFLIT